MNERVVERILVGLLLVVAFGIAIHAPLSVWLGTSYPEWDLVIKAWKELLMGGALAALLYFVYRRNLFGEFMRDRLIQLALVFAGIHFLMVGIFQGQSDAIGAGLLIDLRYVFYFVLVYCTVKLLPDFRNLFLAAIFGGAAVVLGFALLQMTILPKEILASFGYSENTIAPYMTVDQNHDYIRINSTLRGPNPLGAYAVVVFGLIMAAAIKFGKDLKRDQKWAMGLAAVLAGMTVGATYSRSSLVGLLIVVGVIIGMVTTGKLRKHLAIIAGVGLICVSLLLVLTRTNPVVANIIWHDNPTGGALVTSNAAHVESLFDGIDRMVRQPLGAGIGSTGSASLLTKESLIIENQYLYIAHEVGWVGLGIFLWLFIEVMRRLWQRRGGALSLGVFASGVALAVIGMVLPVWADDTVSIVWWGLAAVAVGGVYNARKKH